MRQTQSSITASVTYNYIVGSHYELLINDDHVIVHRHHTMDFYHVKFDELSICMKNLLRKIRQVPDLRLSNFEYAILSDFHRSFTDEEHKMSML